MAEQADVVTTETIEVEWGNAIRDRTAQRYDDLATRSAENATPTAGDLAFMQDTGDLDIYFSGAWRHIGTPAGVVQMNAGATAPPGWLVCNGSAVSRTTYEGLFAAIGTTWGSGDGSTTFNVPDLRGRVPRGVAASGTGNTLGSTFGADTHTHTGPSHTHTGPSHTHGVSGTTGNTGPQTSDGATKGSVGGHSFQGTGANLEQHDHSIPAHSHSFSDTSTASGTAATGASGTGATGSGSTIQAGAALHFIIKT